ncbi:MAG: hypothetical protein E7184_02305 [Erysipelotrichaceae bacterium]|nr:hypothetical protein [Erysipelotrichaceae bacterium]
MSGYSTSTADSKAYDSRLKKMSVNPNPNDTGNSYISKQRFTKPENTFSKPYGNWHLSEEDEKYVDSLEEKYKKRH